MGIKNKKEIIEFSYKEKNKILQKERDILEKENLECQEKVKILESIVNKNTKNSEKYNKNIEVLNTNLKKSEIKINKKFEEKSKNIEEIIKKEKESIQILGKDKTILQS